MARLPPPPTVARIAAKPDSAAADRESQRAASDAEDARARAALPDSVVDLPDAWLADFPDVPPPQPSPSAVEEAASVASPLRVKLPPSPFAPPPLPSTSAIASAEGDDAGDDGVEEIESLSLIEDASADEVPVPVVGPASSVEVPAVPSVEVAAAHEDSPTLTRSETPDLDEARAVAGSLAASMPSRPSVPERPVAAASVPVATSAEGDARKKRLLIGGGLAVVGLIALAIRCAGAPSPTETPGVASASPAAQRAGVSDASASNGAIAANDTARADDDEVVRGEGAANGGKAAGEPAGDAADGAAARADGDAPADSAPAANEGAPAAGAPAADAAAADANAASEGATAADAAAANGAPEADVDVAVDDDGPSPDDKPEGATAQPTARPSSRTDTLTPTKPAADANATPEENLALARAAWKSGNAKDTFKYANKSRYKQPTAEANELATLSACKMKLDESAKSSYKQLEGERKKRARNTCRDFGVRVGL